VSGSEERVEEGKPRAAIHSAFGYHKSWGCSCGGDKERERERVALKPRSGRI